MVKVELEWIWIINKPFWKWWDEDSLSDMKNGTSVKFANAIL